MASSSSAWISGRWRTTGLAGTARKRSASSASRRSRCWLRAAPLRWALVGMVGSKTPSAMQVRKNVSRTERGSFTEGVVPLRCRGRPWYSARALASRATRASRLIVVGSRVRHGTGRPAHGSRTCITHMRRLHTDSRVRWGSRDTESRRTRRRTTSWMKHSRWRTSSGSGTVVHRRCATNQGGRLAPPGPWGARV